MEVGLGGWGQGKSRKKDVGREEGVEAWSVEWVLRREMLLLLLFGFSGSG